MNDTYGIFLIATGNYIQYVTDILSNIKEKFLPHHKKIILLSTDDTTCVEKINYLFDNNFEIYINKINHLGYPSDTLYRFEYFLKFDKKILNLTTFLCFMNINIEINEIVLNLNIDEYDLFFVSHPENKKCNMFVKSVETNKKNTAYLDKMMNCEYICGGFHGGKTKYFLKMCEILKKNIELNDKNNMCAKWYDESHLNWYNCTYNKKLNIIVLNYEYMTNILKPINKNHKLIRSHNYNIIGWSGSILIDIINGCKEYCNGNNVGYQFSNIKYNNSRNGVLKNFFRVENKMKIINYTKNIKCENFDECKIKKFVSMLNFDFNKKTVKKFKKKYNNYVGIILFDMNKEKIQKINNEYKNVLFYRPKKTENNLIKILSLNTILSDGDIFFIELLHNLQKITCINVSYRKNM